ncbi:MAG TPA: RNA-binding transcriptional accessory protein, partial [Cryomorphaceae bacterium]|nr:RNA-binding transcriptional accessory protein [Cryomorphaceae bacterium]
MSAQLIPILSKQLNLPSRSVQNTLTLLDEGATVPFISRYRKEMTGSLDEVQVGNVKEAYQRLQELLKRRQSILESIR